ncbi:MAG TPA: DUF4326 domain-containing protein [Terriglobales bacterium]|nr:DUF4326 domain-containing protein [Terriglobales bacterium]
MINLSDLYTYIPNFYPKHEELFRACEKLPFERTKAFATWGPLKRYQSVNFSERHSKRFNDVTYGGKAFPLSEVFPELLEYREFLARHAGRNINYFGINLYEDENDHIDWHAHREDKNLPDIPGFDSTVWDLSMGSERPFAVRMNGGEPCLFPASPGSLITLSSEFNDLAEHCVPSTKTKPRVKGPYGKRISINAKCVGPRVWSCRKGGKHPADAVYVGRRVARGGVDFPDTPFGNHHHLRPAVFREYLELRMADDPDFKAHVESLRGKDVLCWCGPSEMPHCHAKVVIEIANR